MYNKMYTECYLRLRLRIRLKLRIKLINIYGHFEKTIRIKSVIYSRMSKFLYHNPK